MRRTNRKIYRAFSTPELLVSLLAGAAVVAALAYGSVVGRRALKLSQQQKDIIRSYTEVLHILGTDLNATVKSTGWTAGANEGAAFGDDSYTGITHVDGVGNAVSNSPQDDANVDQFRLLVAPMDQFQIPVDGVLAETDTVTLSLKAPPAEGLGNAIQTKAQASILNAPFVMIRNESFTNIVRVSAVTQDTHLTGLLFHKTSAFDNNQGLTQLKNKSNSIAAVYSVDYVVNAGGNLQRIEKSTRTGPLKTTTIASNIEKLQLFFTFDNRRRAKDIQIPFPRQKLRHPKDPSWMKPNCQEIPGEKACCDPTDARPCANWQDVSQAFLHIVYAVPVDKAPLTQTLGPGFSVENGKLYFRALQPMSLQNYSGELFGSGTSTETTTCLVSDPRNRCKPGCADVFGDPDRNSLHWHGYGKYVGNPDGTSNYCRCGTSGDDPDTFKPPETWEGFNAVPNWVGGGAESDVQVEACIKHFDARQSYDLWAWKHPAVALLHYGFNYDPTWIQEKYYGLAPSPNPDGQYVLKTSALQAIDTNDPSNVAAYQPDMYCRLPDMADSSFGNFARGTWNASYNKKPWATYCKCLGDSDPGLANDWDPNAICNHNKTGVADRVCATTWDGDTVVDGTLTKKVYKVKNGPNNPPYADPNGGAAIRDKDQALLCQCLQESYNGSWIPGTNGFSQGHLWDFWLDRSPNTLHDPDANIRVTRAKIKLPNGTIEDYPSSGSARCDQVYCSLGPAYMFGCVTAPNRTFDARGLSALNSLIKYPRANNALPHDPVTNPGLTRYSSYCDPNGSLVAPGYGWDLPGAGNVTMDLRLDWIRRQITQTPAGQPLPQECGGPVSTGPETEGAN